MPANPWTPSDYYSSAAAALTLMTDVVDGGTERLRERRTTYLPQFPFEEDDNYERRVSQAVLFNATKRTVEGVTGKLLRKAPAFQADSESDPVLAHMNNVDLEGSKANVWIKQWVRAAVRDGLTHAIVDHTRGPGGEEVSREDVKDRGLRPYWVHIPAASLIGWTDVDIDGHRTLTQIRYIEGAAIPDGAYGTKNVQRLRVITRPTDVDEAGKVTLTGGKVTWELYERSTTTGQTEATGMGEMIDQGEMDLDFIPLVTYYTNRTGYLKARPLYLDLAYQNVRHYQSQSTADRGIDVGQYAILALKGLADDKPIQIGPFNAVKLSGENGDAKWVEIAGNALAAAASRLVESEKIMGIEGLSQLHTEQRSAETARAKEIDKTEQNALFETLAEDLQDAINNLLWFHARWMGASTHPEVDINKDFDTLQLTPAHVKELREMRGSGDISREALVDALKRGEWLPDTYDADEDMEQILAELSGELEATVREMFAPAPAAEEEEGGEEEEQAA